MWSKTECKYFLKDPSFLLQSVTQATSKKFNCFSENTIRFVPLLVGNNFAWSTVIFNHGFSNDWASECYATFRCKWAVWAECNWHGMRSSLSNQKKPSCPKLWKTFLNAGKIHAYLLHSLKTPWFPTNWLQFQIRSSLFPFFLKLI